MAIMFGLMLLADHKEVQEKLYEEVSSKLGESSQASMAELSELKYLEAVIKETLRLYPSVPFIARLVTEEFMLGDIKLPKGTEVAVHIYDLHRRASLYPDPETFKPERFLEGGPRHTFAFVPFSAGPRNCIGQRFAMLEMKYFFYEIIKNFKLSPTKEGYRPALVSDLVLRPAEPIFVKFNKR